MIFKIISAYINFDDIINIETNFAMCSILAHKFKFKTKYDFILKYNTYIFEEYASYNLLYT